MGRQGTESRRCLDLTSEAIRESTAIRGENATPTERRGTVKKGSPCKSDRLTGFATMLQAGCESTKGRRRSWLVRAAPSLVLVAAIGHFTVARVEGAKQPTHQNIQDGVGAVQTTVNGIDEKVEAVQGAVDGIAGGVNAVSNTVGGIDEKVIGIKSSLERIPPAWSQILPAADRFQLVMGGAAVLDKETGLVWWGSPFPEPMTWYSAQWGCVTIINGGRLGWRLPTVQELASLIDPTQSKPALPAGHLFNNVQSSSYWSASTVSPNIPSDPWWWAVDLSYGGVFIVDNGVPLYAWCVRGGQGVDPQ